MSADVTSANVTSIDAPANAETAQINWTNTTVKKIENFIAQYTARTLMDRLTLIEPHALAASCENAAVIDRLYALGWDYSPLACLEAVLLRLARFVGAKAFTRAFAEYTNGTEVLAGFQLLQYTILEPRANGAAAHSWLGKFARAARGDDSSTAQIASRYAIVDHYVCDIRWAPNIHCKVGLTCRGAVINGESIFYTQARTRTKKQLTTARSITQYAANQRARVLHCQHCPRQRLIRHLLHSAR